jgi:hypothetical protein
MTADEFKLLVVNLPQASTLDLYRLAYICRALYNEPHRVLAVRKELHVGKTVQYFDSTAGTIHTGRIIALRDRDCALEDRERNLRFKSLPYAAIDLTSPQSEEQVQSQERPSFATHHMPDSRAQAPREKLPTKSDFEVGGRVSFENRDGIMLIGTIIRINQKTASVLVENTGGHWRISYSLLRPLLDI